MRTDPIKRHQPSHVYLDNKIYFLTVHVYDNRLFLDDKRRLEILEKFKEEFLKYHYKWYAYVILYNHYHLLFRTLNGKDLSEILKLVHGGLSYKWNKEDNCQGRRFFQNYWDYCPRDEEDFYRHLNYIHINPIKHKIVKDFDELKKYKYSSFNKWIDKEGEDLVFGCLEAYPIGDYLVPDEEIKV